MEQKKIKIKLIYNNNQQIEIEFNFNENYRKIRNKINKICSITMNDREVEYYFLNENNERCGYYTLKDHKKFLKQKNFIIFVINKAPNKKTIVFKIDDDDLIKTKEKEEKKEIKEIKIKIIYNNIQEIGIINENNYVKIKNQINKICSISTNDEVECYFFNENNEKCGYYNENDHEYFLKQKNLIIYVLNNNKKTINFEIDKNIYFYNLKI